MLRVSLDILDTEGVMDAVSQEKADVGFIYADRMHHNSLSYLLHKKSLEMYEAKSAVLHLQWARTISCIQGEMLRP